MTENLPPSYLRSSTYKCSLHFWRYKSECRAQNDYRLRLTFGRRKFWEWNRRRVASTIVDFSAFGSGRPFSIRQFVPLYPIAVMRSHLDIDIEPARVASLKTLARWINSLLFVEPLQMSKCIWPFYLSFDSAVSKSIQMFRAILVRERVFRSFVQNGRRLLQLSMHTARAQSLDVRTTVVFCKYICYQTQWPHSFHFDVFIALCIKYLAIDRSERH